MMMMTMTRREKKKEETAFDQKTYRNIIAVDWPCKPPIFVVVVLFGFLLLSGHFPIGYKTECPCCCLFSYLTIKRGKSVWICRVPQTKQRQSERERLFFFFGSSSWSTYESVRQEGKVAAASLPTTTTDTYRVVKRPEQNSKEEKKKEKTTRGPLTSSISLPGLR